VLALEDWDWDDARVRTFVIFCSREVMVGGVGRRESERRSRKWKFGLREMSRAYLLVSTLVRCTGVLLYFSLDVLEAFSLNICGSCPSNSSNRNREISTYRSSSELVLPKGEVAHPAHEDDGCGVCGLGQG
jgi:hypothetical protein